MKRARATSEVWFRMSGGRLVQRAPWPTHWKGWLVYLIAFGGAFAVVVAANTVPSVAALLAGDWPFGVAAVLMLGGIILIIRHAG